MFAIPKGSGAVHFAVLVASIVWAGAGCSSPGPPVEPPRPATLDAIDESLAEEIREALERVELSPADASAWMTLGMVYEANRMFDLALPCYEHVVEMQPDDPRSWYRLALTRGRSGDLEGGVQALERVHALDPSYGPAYWKRGFSLLDAGRLPEAETAFRRALEVDRRDPAAWAGMARVHLKNGDPREAVRLLETVLASQPQRRYFHHLVGIAYREAGEPDEAEKHLQLGRDSVAAWLDPWSLELARYKSGLRWALAEADRARMDGRYDLAIPALLELRKKEPTDQQILATLGKAYVGAGRVEEGLETLLLMIDLHPDNFRAHLDIALAYEQAGRPGPALEHADRALELNPEFAAAHWRRGQILRGTGRFEEAAAALARSVELDPDDTIALTVLGECLIELRRWDEARSHLESAVRVQPDNGYAYLKLGVARMNLGDAAGAREALNEAARIDSRLAGEANALLADLGQGG